MHNSFSESPLEVTGLAKYLNSVACSISSFPSCIPMGVLQMDIAFVFGALICSPN